MPRYDERPLTSRDFANFVAEIMAAGCDISALGYDISPPTGLEGARRAITRETDGLRLRFPGGPPIE